MRAGFNPTRRNRNIGTAAQGHGQDNRLVIPRICHDERRWSHQLNPYQRIQRVVAGCEIIFLVEDLHGGCVHACSVDDVRHVLANVPMADWEGLDTIVLRQSTRKQRLLNPTWGWMSYSADLGLPGRKAARRGPMLALEAVDCDAKLEWPSSLRPPEMAELERLRADGHQIVQDGARHVFSMTPQSVRATQLYRTLLHEIGHWVDFQEKVERPGAAGDDAYDALFDLYFARPRDEREAFAHRYADETRARLTRFGALPFEPISGLRPRLSAPSEPGARPAAEKAP